MSSIPLRPLPRRTLLKGLGVALALPLLDCMPLAAKEPAAGAGVGAGATTASGAPRRLFAINTYQSSSARASAPATAPSSTSTSPRCANSSAAWSPPRSGSRGPSRTSTPRRRRT